jgi:hypothetical protein
MADTDIDVAFVNSYRSTIDLQYQQMTSRMQELVRVEMQNSERDFYDRIGPTAMVLLTVRHADTPDIAVTFDRRAVTLQDYVWNSYIDKADRIRMLADPTGPYAQNAMAAMGRQIDTVLVTAATGISYGGHDGNTQIPWSSFTSTQQVAVNYVEGGGSPANSNLTIGKLRKGLDILKSAEAIDEGEEVSVVCAQSQITSLLRTTEVTNTDFNTVRALVSGEIDTFLGCRFKHTQVTLKSGNNRSALMFPRRGMVLSFGMAPQVNVSPRPDKNYSIQVHLQCSLGASRMWEQQMVEILCDETT